MAITLDLPPDKEQLLRRRAELAGQDVADYLLQGVGLMTLPPPLSNEEWERLVDELADTVPPDAPLFSDYDVSREGIYRDHD